MSFTCAAQCIVSGRIWFTMKFSRTTPTFLSLWNNPYSDVFFPFYHRLKQIFTHSFTLTDFNDNNSSSRSSTFLAKSKILFVFNRYVSALCSILAQKCSLYVSSISIRTHSFFHILFCFVCIITSAAFTFYFNAVH